jgi:predicted ester cyclase
VIGIPPHLEARWRELDQPSRDHVDAFLSPEPTPCDAAPNDRVNISVATPLPSTFADDLAIGGPQLRAAFPQLQRTLAGITRKGSRITVRIACEGGHVEPFFGIVRATQRHVQFVEEHRMEVRDGRLCEDQIAIDLAGIIRQLHVADS